MEKGKGEGKEARGNAERNARALGREVGGSYSFVVSAILRYLPRSGPLWTLSARLARGAIQWPSGCGGAGAVSARCVLGDWEGKDRVGAAVFGAWRWGLRYGYCGGDGGNHATVCLRGEVLVVVGEIRGALGGWRVDDGRLRMFQVGDARRVLGGRAMDAIGVSHVR